MSKTTFEAWAMRWKEDGELSAECLEDLFSRANEAGAVSSLYDLVRVRVTVEPIEEGEGK